MKLIRKRKRIEIDDKFFSILVGLDTTENNVTLSSSDKWVRIPLDEVSGLDDALLSIGTFADLNMDWVKKEDEDDKTGDA